MSRHGLMPCRLCLCGRESSRDRQSMPMSAKRIGPNHKSNKKSSHKVGLRRPMRRATIPVGKHNGNLWTTCNYCVDHVVELWESRVGLGVKSSSNQNVDRTFLFDFYTYYWSIWHHLATIHNASDDRKTEQPEQADNVIELAA